MAVFEEVKEEDLKRLISKGFVKDKTKTIHEAARFVLGKASLVLYNSGKLLVQGPAIDKEKVADVIRKLHLGIEVKPIRFRKEEGWIIGTDETLKGDTFGGLVVAGVRADDDIRAKLKEMGVADSKKLSDLEIVHLAQKIKLITSCEIKSLLPEEYNRKEGNVTTLLNSLHKEVGKYLKPGNHVVDKYPGCSVGDIREEKAESKFIEVAAASILARDAGLTQIRRLSMQAGFDLPLGSTHVKEALEELKKRGLSFENYVKMHFKNVQEFL